MGNLLKIWNKITLVQQILLGLAVGTVLGVIAPQLTAISMFGTLFAEALKGIAPVLVFFLVMGALAQQKDGVKNNMGYVVMLYCIGTFLAAVLAVVASYLFPVTIVLTDAAGGTGAPDGVVEVLKTLLLNMVQNPVASLAQGNYIGILAWASVFGLALRMASPATKEMLHNLSEGISQAVRWVIRLAPLGIMGLVFTTVSTNGMGIFYDYGKILALLVGCMLLMGLVVNPIIVYCNTRENPYPLVFTCIRGTYITLPN